MALVWDSLLTQTIKRMVADGWELVDRTDKEAVLKITDQVHRNRDLMSFATSGSPWFGLSKRGAQKHGEFALLRVGVMGRIVSWTTSEPIDLPSNEWPPPGSDL
ncbi:hypothetical protein GE115_04170 [Agromyces sp. CFH 90414]|uniref:Uncharacterized protein n=1 Tax=Agromyces agglutinans TaxID=2662258 RepID=A0A6I2F5S2_9MICO|nr:hypothetical protein [Agromyces agglutinans]MRG59067.1 hypothetical protein [Agromyces agglutinans]